MMPATFSTSAIAVPTFNEPAMFTANLHSAKILIVDDQPVGIAILRQLLTGAGYTDVSSTTEARGVAALHRQFRYDLIVLDLEMPDMEGFEVLDSLRQLEARQYLPVLAMSAWSRHKLRALEAGARDSCASRTTMAKC